MSEGEIKQLLGDRAKKTGKKPSDAHGWVDDGLGAQDAPTVEDHMFHIPHLTKEWRKVWEKLGCAH